MTVAIVLAAWIVLSFPVAVLVGKCIHFGTKA